MAPAKRKAARKKATGGSKKGGSKAKKAKKTKLWCTQDLNFRSSDDALWITNRYLRSEMDRRYRAGTLKIGYNDPNAPGYEVNVKC